MQPLITLHQIVTVKADQFNCQREEVLTTMRQNSVPFMYLNKLHGNQG